MCCSGTIPQHCNIIGSTYRHCEGLATRRQQSTVEFSDIGQWIILKKCMIECVWYMWRNLFTNIILTHTLYFPYEWKYSSGILLENEYTNQKVTWLWNIIYLINFSSHFDQFQESCFNITSLILRVDLTDELKQSHNLHSQEHPLPSWWIVWQTSHCHLFQWSWMV